jgi:hypothetical protein
MDDLPQTIASTTDAQMALASAWQLAARPSVDPGIPNGTNVPWHTPKPLRLNLSPGLGQSMSPLPPVLATSTDWPCYHTASGLAGVRTASETAVTDVNNQPMPDSAWRLVPSSPLRASRGLVVITDPRASTEGLPVTLARAATAVLTAADYADQLEAAMPANAARRSLRSEVSDLRAFAEQVTQLLPALAAPWWPDTRAAVIATYAPAAAQPYTRKQISLKQ